MNGIWVRAGSTVIFVSDLSIMHNSPHGYDRIYSLIANRHVTIAESNDKEKLDKILNDFQKEVKKISSVFEIEETAE